MTLTAMHMSFLLHYFEASFQGHEPLVSPLALPLFSSSFFSPFPCSLHSLTALSFLPLPLSLISFPCPSSCPSCPLPRKSCLPRLSSLPHPPCPPQTFIPGPLTHHPSPITLVPPSPPPSYRTQTLQRNQTFGSGLFCSFVWCGRRGTSLRAALFCTKISRTPHGKSGIQVTPGGPCNTSSPKGKPAPCHAFLRL